MFENKKILILDFSNISYSAFHACQSDTKDLDKEKKTQYWKYLFLNSIRKLNLKFKPNEFIIAVDSRSWRNQYFPYYKAKRNQQREKSNLDFQDFFDTMNESIEELQTVFPYITLKVKNAEADDIIAVLTTKLHNQEKEIIIASNDKDFVQLLKYPNVKLYNLRTEKFIKSKDPKEDLIYLVLGGDSSDGIPNVMNPDDAFIRENYVYTVAFKKWLAKKYNYKLTNVDDYIKELEESKFIKKEEDLYYRETKKNAQMKERQKPLGPKKICKILEEGFYEWLENDEEIKRNYERNKRLIALTRETIPESVWTDIIRSYENYPLVKKDYMKLMTYFTKGRMISYLDSISDFL